MAEIVSVDSDCEITFSDGVVEPCRHRPNFTFAECDLGYGAHGDCPKYNYYHRELQVRP